MKTKEQIEQRLETLQNRLESARKYKDEELKLVSDTISKKCKYPEHVAEWVNTWMENARYYDAEIEDIKKQITVIEWILEA